MKQELLALLPADAAAEQDSSATAAAGEERPAGRGGKGGSGKLTRGVSNLASAMGTSPSSSPSKGGEASPGQHAHGLHHKKHNFAKR